MNQSIGGIISWYTKDINLVEKAEEFKARGNRHIRIVRAAEHCLNSEPRSGQDYDYYAARHELAGFANSSNFPNAYFFDELRRAVTPFLLPFRQSANLARARMVSKFSSATISRCRCTSALDIGVLDHFVNRHFNKALCLLTVTRQCLEQAACDGIVC